MRYMTLIGVAGAAFTAFAAISLSAFGAGAPFAAKPGLWQVTVQMSGMAAVPAAALARLTPQQRAAIAAEMNKPVSMKECLTAVELQNGFDVSRTPASTLCTRAILTASATSLSAHVECKGAHSSSTGTFRVDLIDAQDFRGSMNMIVTHAGKTSTVQSTMVGKWLGSDCGHVKPGQPE